jgi:hypothetical protein
MSLPRHWTQSYLELVPPQNFPLNSRERQSAVERSLIEPVEYRPARREKGSDSLRRFRVPDFQVHQLGPPIAMRPRREALPKYFEGLGLTHETDLPLVKNPAHRLERLLPLAFECYEPDS